MELQVTMLAGACSELRELKEIHAHAISRETRAAELQSELAEAERDGDELDSRHKEQSEVVQSLNRRIKDLEQTLTCTKAVTAAYNEREKENEGLREQWEVLASAALVRDTALAKAQENVRRLESHNQQLSASSVDLADKLAAVTADRDKRSVAAAQMLSSAKDNASRSSKECSFYKTKLETLQNLVVT